MADPTAPFEAGVASANNPDDPKSAQTSAEIKDWHKKLKEARNFDEPARKQFARDRRYARGDKGAFEVSVPIASSSPDIKTAFLYARNPDLDIQPSKATNPPPMADIIAMARQDIGQLPQTHDQMIAVGQAAADQAVQAQNAAMANAVSNGLGDPAAGKNIMPVPVSPELAGEQAAQAWLNETIKAKAKEIMKPYRDRLSQAKQFGQTMEVVVENLWMRAFLRKAMNKDVRSCLSVGQGWLKVTWQERAGNDPTTANDDRDMQDNLAKLAELKQSMDSGEAKDPDLVQGEIDETMQGLQAKVEVMVNRGLAIDFVRAEDIQVSSDVTSIEDYLDSPWIDHRTYYRADVANAMFPDIADKIDKAKTYYPKKQPNPDEVRDVGSMADNIDVYEADAFRDSGPIGETPTLPKYVCIHEIWHKSTGMVLTTCDGIQDQWARAPYAPNPGTTRFYPFFLLAMQWVDGERHPQSLVQRSKDLFDGVNRTYSNRREFRRRTIPKNVFDRGNMSEEDAKRLEAGTQQEYIGLDPTVPGTPVANMVAPLAYARYDPSLYDDRPAMQKLEILWGIQEALASATQTVEKTATEAEIQQTGTNSRTSHERSAIDSVMDDLAQYTAEIAVQKMQHEDVVQIAGPWAFWPEGITIQDMSLLVTVAIKGGSSGKPDTSAQQQAWAATLPLLQKSILQIGQLSRSTASDIADCLEELVTETLNRTGDRLEPSRFMPPQPSSEPGQMPSGQPGMQPQGPPPQVTQGQVNAAGHTPRPIHAMPAPPRRGQLPVPHNGQITMPAETMQ